MGDPRTRRRERTRQAILEAAIEIVRKLGPGELSMRTLAERTDYSAAGIYEYFASKDEIIAAVCQQGQDRLTAYMRQSDETAPTADYLLAIGLAYIRFAVENPDYFLLMFASQPVGTRAAAADDAAATGMPSSFGILVATVQRGLDEGIFAARPGFGLMEMVYAAWATVHGIAMLRAIGLRDYPADLETADAEVLRNLIRGLQTR